MSDVYGTNITIGDFEICLTESGILHIENKTASLFIEANDRSSLSIHPDRITDKTQTGTIGSRFIKRNQFVRIVKHENSDYVGIEGQILEVYERNSVTMVRIKLIDQPATDCRFADVEIITKPSVPALGMRVSMETTPEISLGKITGEILFIGAIIEKKHSIVVVTKTVHDSESYSTSRYCVFYEDVDVLFV